MGRGNRIIFADKLWFGGVRSKRNQVCVGMKGSKEAGDSWNWGEHLKGSVEN